MAAMPPWHLSGFIRYNHETFCNEYRNMAVSKHHNYNQNFYAWALANAELIRQKKFFEIDIENVVEELEGMVSANRRELVNRLSVLLAHLLQWQYQPKRRGKSWRVTIQNQRIEIKYLLEVSPSLKHELEQRIKKSYASAVLLAAAETAFDTDKFPDEFPYALSDCLDTNFLPE